MKKSILILFLATYSISYSQQTLVPFGLHYNIGNSNTKEVGIYNGTIDVIESNSYIFGMEFGLGGATNGEDYTGTININQYTEDRIGTESHTLWNIGFRAGKEIYKNLYLIGTLGYIQLSEFEDRYDNFNILGSNGSYVVLKEKKDNIYVKLGVSYRINKIIPEVSIGSTGLQFGCSFILL